MSDLFPKWTNRLPVKVLAGLAVVSTAATAGVWYYFSPEYTRVGYAPLQPVAFSHNVHAEQLGLDCRYCHAGVEQSWYSPVPASSVCLNCHVQVLKDDPRLAPARESVATGTPIPWVQVHKLPDYVHFNHAVHVRRGVSCFSCHGPVHQMDEVREAKSLSMTFCLDCHRRPEAHLRPPAEVFHLNWQPASPDRQLAEGRQRAREWKVRRLEYCSTCHR